MLEMPP